jgi:hypothetical protein
MIYGEREAGKKWDDDTTLPLCALVVRTNDTMNDCIANLVLNSYIVNSRPISRLSHSLDKGRETLHTM